MIDAPTRKRLQSALTHHYNRGREKGLPAERISVASLLAKTPTNEDGAYLCACGRVVSFDPDDVGKPHKATIGHKFHLSAKDRPHAFSEQTHPGHTLENTVIECWACNKGDNETVVAPCNAKARAHQVIKGRPKTGSIQSRGFSTPKGYVSPLSKKSEFYRTRKVGS